MYLPRETRNIRWSCFRRLLLPENVKSSLIGGLLFLLTYRARNVLILNASSRITREKTDTYLPIETLENIHRCSIYIYKKVKSS